MTNKNIEDPAKYWREHLDKLKASDLSRAEYCRQNALTMSTMIYWEKRLLRINKNAAKKEGGAKAFVKAAIAAPSYSPRQSVRLLVGNGLIVECDTSIDPSWVVALAHAVRSPL